MINFLYNRDLDIPSSVDGLNMCLIVVNDIGRIFSLNFEMKLSLHTVVVEAIENAIIHGNNSDREKLVKFSIQVNCDKIFICVEDQGEGFNIDSISSPIMKSTIRNESGRGIFFIKMLSESCYTLGKGNIIKIIMNR